MWDKVKSYMDDPSSYTNAPAVTDYSCILVKSLSSTRPHFVQKTSKCAKECLMYKSTNGICSHTLLAASLSSEVDDFVILFSKSKVPVNYAQHGLPAGGKKKTKCQMQVVKPWQPVLVFLNVRNILQWMQLPQHKQTQSYQFNRHQTQINKWHLILQHTDMTLLRLHRMQAINTLSTGVNLSSDTSPPLIHYSPGSFSEGQPFSVMFLIARISRCQGWCGQTMQGLPAPHDVVSQHKEHVLFENPYSVNWQFSRGLRNACYHSRFACISSKRPDFNNFELLISPEVLRILTSFSTTFWI